MPTKANKKEFKIVAWCIVMMLMVLCAFNVTYAYFSAESRLSGNLKFANFDVRFICMYGGGANMLEMANGQTSLTIYPKAGQNISRGSTFSFQTAAESGQDIEAIGFNSKGAAAHVRLFVNAYRVSYTGTQINVDRTINYGQYFQLVSASPVYTSATKTATDPTTNNAVTNTVYYITDPVEGTMLFANAIKLLEQAPVELLDSDVQIEITFEAVQAANKAYQSVFNDGWGYLDVWGNG